MGATIDGQRVTQTLLNFDAGAWRQKASSIHSEKSLPQDAEPEFFQIKKQPSSE